MCNKNTFLLRISYEMGPIRQHSVLKRNTNEQFIGHRRTTET